MEHSWVNNILKKVVVERSPLPTFGGGGVVEQCPPECGTLFLLQFLIMCLENHIRD